VFVDVLVEVEVEVLVDVLVEVEVEVEVNVFVLVEVKVGVGLLVGVGVGVMQLAAQEAANMFTQYSCLPFAYMAFPKPQVIFWVPDKGTLA
jgi:hypothetical protein